MTESLSEQVNRSLRAAGVSTEDRHKTPTATLKDRRSNTDGTDQTKVGSAHVVPDHFIEPEEGPDEVILKHAEQERCNEQMKKRDRKVKLAMLGVLSAADSIASAQSRRRDRE